MREGGVGGGGRGLWGKGGAERERRERGKLEREKERAKAARGSFLEHPQQVACTDSFKRFETASRRRPAAQHCAAPAGPFLFLLLFHRALIVPQRAAPLFFAEC